MSITDVPSATAARAVSFLLALFFVVGCSASGPAATNLDTRLLGEWETDSGARYSIAADGKEYVIGIVDYDDEVFEVESVLWEDGTLAWTYFVPSTGYRVSEETISISESNLEVRWENQTGATGVDILTRVE